jgi:hypothetical protein
MLRALLYLLSIIIIYGLTGCITPSPPKTIYAPYVKLITPDAVIEAENGSFKINSNKLINTPPQATAICVRIAEPFNNKKILIDDYNNFVIFCGAKRVRVTVPYVDKSLYGVLALLKFEEDTTGPATRIYQLEIPRIYVTAASGGKVSAVYERTPDNRYAWILWLSDLPLQ